MTWTARCAPCLVPPLMSCAFTSALHTQTTIQSLHLATCFHLTMKLLKTGLTAAPGPLVKQRKIQTDRVQLGYLYSSPQHWKHRTLKQDGRLAENILKMILKQWNLRLYKEVTQKKIYDSLFISNVKNLIVLKMLSFTDMVSLVSQTNWWNWPVRCVHWSASVIPFCRNTLNYISKNNPKVPICVIVLPCCHHQASLLRVSHKVNLSPEDWRPQQSQWRSAASLAMAEFKKNSKMATETINFRLIKGAFFASLAQRPGSLWGSRVLSRPSCGHCWCNCVLPLQLVLATSVLAGHIELRFVLSLCPRRDKVGLPHVLAGLQRQLLSAGTCGTAFRPRSSHELLRYINPSAESLWN